MRYEINCQGKFLKNYQFIWRKAHFYTFIIHFETETYLILCQVFKYDDGWVECMNGDSSKSGTFVETKFICSFVYRLEPATPRTQDVGGLLYHCAHCAIYSNMFIYSALQFQNKLFTHPGHGHFILLVCEFSIRHIFFQLQIFIIQA